MCENTSDFNPNEFRKDLFTEFNVEGARMPDSGDIKLSPEQEMAAERMLEWFNNTHPSKQSTFSLAGYAGTGKTTLVCEFRKMLESESPYLKVGFIAFTGKAAHILKKKLKAAGAFMPWDYSGTIHSLIYRFAGYQIVEEEDKKKDAKYDDTNADAYIYACADLEDDDDYDLDGDEIVETTKKSTKKLKEELLWECKEKQPCDLLIVDESSMINETIYRDLMSYGVSIIFVGDPGQLPPVGGKDCGILSDPDSTLQEIHRQAAENPIIQLAHAIRHGEKIKERVYNESVAWLPLSKARDLVSRFIAKDICEMESIYLCGTNLNRTRMNYIARSVHKYNGPPQPGEKIVCLRNNRRSNIMNGQFGRVITCEDLDDFNYLLKVQMEGHLEPLITACYKKAFGRSDHSKDHRDLRANKKINEGLVKLKSIPMARTVGPYDNVDLFDYGYAVSTHKAQGSEWKNVVVINEVVSYKTTKEDHRKWLYTAVTRSSDRLLVVS